MLFTGPVVLTAVTFGSMAVGRGGWEPRLVSVLSQVLACLTLAILLRILLECAMLVSRLFCESANRRRRGLSGGGVACVGLQEEQHPWPHCHGPRVHLNSLDSHTSHQRQSPLSLPSAVEKVDALEMGGDDPHDMA